MAHDTSATAAGYSKCEGAKITCGRRVHGSMPKYYCSDDDMPSGEAGSEPIRGLVLRDNQTACSASRLDAFERWEK
jgi:hypothetical protein